ncbi:MAG: molybdopterin-binding protein, partial [Desulfobulbus sp.]
SAPAREQTGTSQPEADLFDRNRKRNHYPGRIVEVHRDTLQSQVILCTPAGHHISAIVSNESADRLALQPGNRITAEIKPHAVSPQTNNTYATSSIDNCFSGEILGINRGRVSWECIVDIGGGTTIYSLVSVHYAATLRLKVGKKVWVSFNSFAVILHIL